MKNHIDLHNQDFSFLGKNSIISGEFHFEGPAHIASRLNGDVYMEKKNDLCIERNGHITGTIKCHNIEIYGTFEGTLEASGKIIIYPPANITGKISASDLVIYPGAILNIDGNTAL